MMQRVENHVTAMTTLSNLPKAVKITLDRLCESVNMLVSEVERLTATPEEAEIVVETDEGKKEEVLDEEG